MSYRDNVNRERDESLEPGSSAESTTDADAGSSYYYDDSTGYEIFQDDETKEEESESNAKD